MEAKTIDSLINAIHDIQKFKKLLSEGCEISHHGIFLFIAMYSCDNYEIVNLILKLGGDTNYRGKFDGKSITSILLEKGDLHLVKKFILYGYNPPEDTFPILFEIAKKNSEDQNRKLHKIAEILLNFAPYWDYVADMFLFEMEIGKTDCPITKAMLMSGNSDINRPGQNGLNLFQIYFLKRKEISKDNTEKDFDFFSLFDLDIMSFVPWLDSNNLWTAAEKHLIVSKCL